VQLLSRAKFSVPIAKQNAALALSVAATGHLVQDGRSRFQAPAFHADLLDART
jgi:hypothetical protein